MSAAQPRFRPRGSVRRHAALAAGLLASLAGCGPPEVPYPFAELEGRVLSDRPLLVVPNRAWRRDEPGEIWYFAHAASLICQVDEPPAEPIVFSFLPADGEAPDLVFLWDGEDVTGRRRREASGELAVEIPAASLTAGVHFLSLRRRDPGGDAEVLFHRFRSIGYRHRGEARVLPARDFLTFRYLSSLLSFGVTGSFHRQSLGGFVLAGPRTLEVDLGSERGGLLQFKVQNAGAGGAAFRVRWRGGAREVRLEPHQRRHLRLALPPGASKVGLVASGDPNGFFLWGAPHFRPRAAAARPPVVLITLDTTRRDAFAVYGGEAAATPRLDAFAARATVFEHAYTTAPWTLPAHASIFTGLYPSRHGAGVRGDHLEIGFVTLAERLRAAGYVTAGFAGGMLSSGHFGVGQGFATYRNADGAETAADELTAHATGFLEETGALGDDFAPPFFLFVNYFDPHFPYRAPEPFRRAFAVADRRRAVGDDALWQATLDGSAKAWASVVDGQAPASSEALAALRAAYLAEVAFMDDQVGELLARLEERGLFDDALIVVTADHGELLGESGYFSHSGRLDGELVEIPLIVKWPGQREGRRDGRLTSLVDLFPTVLAAAGVPPDGPRLDGHALGPGSGDRRGDRAFVIAEEHGSGFHRLPPRLRVADDLFAVLGLAERLLRWDGGGACWRRSADAWGPVTCEGRRFAGLKILRELERAAHRPRMARIGFSREERQRLEALGYLR